MTNDIFTGLSAFPITPMNEDSIDEEAFIRLIQELAEKKVNSIGVLGSTGNYAYLTLEQRIRLTELAVRAAGDIPVIVGIGSLRTKDVIQLAHSAQQVGAAGLLLAPVSYQPLRDEEVYSLYKDVNDAVDIPICVYDNPSTTHFVFNDDLYAQLAELSNIQSFKIPGISEERFVAQERIASLRQLLPNKIRLGISGDASGVMGLVAGCDMWYSVIGGLFPNVALRMVSLVKEGRHEEAFALSAQLLPLWNLFKQYKGSLRVIATAAELLGKVSSPCLPKPLQTLEGEAREYLRNLLKDKSLYA
ncbi:MAG: dihydrodipicolinate synthase family protein [Pelistega sp.]|nr:dihydrodipicolinate synthase family protein [Pelistega sp.]